MMELVVAKILVLSALFVITFVCGIIPVRFVKFANARSWTEVGKRRYIFAMSFLSCFGAGVFLATCFLGLFPDVVVTLSTAFSNLNIRTSYPVPEFILVFGFFIILFMEQVVLSVKEKQYEEGSDKKPLLSSKVSRSDLFENSIEGIRDDPLQTRVQISPSNIEHRNKIDRSSEDEGTDENGHLEVSQNIVLTNHSHSVVRSLLLLLALSMHSLFEGLAVGLEHTIEDVLSLFAALVLHKSILSFSLGMNLIQSSLSPGAIYRSILTLSLTSPLGVGIGIGIINLWTSEYSLLIQGVLQGLACGTFVYVTFFEIMPHEFNSSGQRMFKILFLLLGYSTVAGILFLNQENKSVVCIQP